LFTRAWTLLIRAMNGEIEGYIVPNEMAIRFTANPGEFSRFMAGRLEVRAGSPCLLLNGEVVSQAETSFLARELFGYLVRIAEGAATPQQTFVFRRDGTLAAPAQAAQAQRHPLFQEAAAQSFELLGGSPAPAPRAPQPASAPAQQAAPATPAAGGQIG